MLPALPCLVLVSPSCRSLVLTLSSRSFFILACRAASQHHRPSFLVQLMSHSPSTPLPSRLTFLRVQYLSHAPSTHFTARPFHTTFCLNFAGSPHLRRSLAHSLSRPVLVSLFAQLTSLRARLMSRSPSTFPLRNHIMPHSASISLHLLVVSHCTPRLQASLLRG